jgi:hypothetical protein
LGRRPSIAPSLGANTKTGGYTPSAQGPRRDKGQIELPDIKLTQTHMAAFARKIGKNLLKNDSFLDKLADVLDGMEVSESE